MATDAVFPSLLPAGCGAPEVCATCIVSKKALEILAAQAIDRGPVGKDASRLFEQPDSPAAESKDLVAKPVAAENRRFVSRSLRRMRRPTVPWRSLPARAFRARDAAPCAETASMRTGQLRRGLTRLPG